MRKNNKGLDRHRVGNNIATARILAGYSQSELCKLAELSKSTLSKYENGHKMPSIENLYRICIVTQTSASRILGV